MTERHLVIAGFHRSGTSMTAQLLHKAGLSLGRAMILPDPSNTDGHFEDADIVEAHDDILGDSGARWDHDFDALPTVSALRLENLRRIAAERDRSFQMWGFKDPRSCLLLESWRDVLADPPVLVVYRHFEACAGSLRHRAARSIVQSPPAAGALRFWLDPELALRMWLVHNRALVAYAQSHSERTLVVAQHDVLAGFPVVAELRRRFGLALDETAATGIRPNANSGAIAGLGSVSSELLASLEQTWDDLNRLAGASPWVATSPQPPPIAPVSEQIMEVLTRHGLAPSEAHVPTELDLARRQLSETQPASSTRGEGPARVRLGEALLTAGRMREARKLLEVKSEDPSVEAARLVALGRAELELRCHDAAERSLRHAVQLAPLSVVARAQLARVLIARGGYAEADAILGVLLEDHPRAPVVPVLLASSNLRQGRHSVALSVTKTALTSLGHSIPVHVSRVQALHRAGQLHQALEAAVSARASFPDNRAVNELAGALFHACGRHEEGREVEYQIAASALEDPSYPDRLVDAVDRVPGSRERVDLTGRVGHHLPLLVAKALQAPAHGPDS